MNFLIKYVEHCRVIPITFAAMLVAMSCADRVDAKPEGNNECLYSLSNAPRNTPKFADWPVTSVKRFRSVRLALVHNPSARLYRTALRTAAEQGPNFAGHYRIAVWGCGSSCTDWGLVDLVTGKVTFDESLRAISGVHIQNNDNPPVDEYLGLKFRRDSVLLIVLGAPRQDEKQEGIRYYRWTGRTFRLLRFVGRTEACGDGPQ